MVKKSKKSSIITLRKEGKSVNEIAKILKCGKSTVSYHINKVNLGGKLNKTERKFSDSLDEKTINLIIENKKNGLTYKEIKLLTNISYDKLKRICRTLNINKFYKRKLSDDKINLIKKTYNELKSIRKTSEKLGISRHYIRQHINIVKNKMSVDERKKSFVKSVNKHRINTKKKLVEMKGGKCCECGYKKSLCALTFHHINPKEKDFTIGGRNYSWEKMINEVNKCILLCLNCHAELHEKIRTEEKNSQNILI